jgi:hypothetical protein
MQLRHDVLSRQPEAFDALTGLSPDEFEGLLADSPSAQRRRREAATRTHDGRPRRRASGAGRPTALDDRHRLLLALVWLRIYPTYRLLGALFGLDKRNAQLNCRDVLAALAAMGTFPFEQPPDRREALTAPRAVMDAFPQVRLVIDTKEQRTRRPQGEARQKPYYSGKKRCHTVKTQIAVAPDGTIQAVSGSAPGGAWHDLTLLRSTGIPGRLDPGADEGAMLDKGYPGVQKDRPEVAIFTPVKAPRGGSLTDEQKESNRWLARYRVVVEHTIAQLARYQVLRRVWRGTVGHHSRVIRAVAAVVDRRLRRVPLKTYAAA